jgi:glycosyltransferase involved in cell wall biosynthesis
MKKQYLIGRSKNATRIIRQQGLLAFSILALQKIQKKNQKTSHNKKIKISFLAKYQDVLQAKWSTHPYDPNPIKTKLPLTINWVMSPPGKGVGGGHQNIFRFIAYLVSRGHKCNVYLYSGQFFQEEKEAQQVFNAAYPDAEVTFKWLDGPVGKADAIFATGWETAYPVFNDPGKARKFYFVQDFEPYFYPLGSEYILAENTYRMNLYGITAGGWLDDKLSKEYGMMCDHYDFGTDSNLYRFENKGKRKEIFFYARPVTARRGFELGIMALQLFNEQRPEYTITLAGWDVSEYQIPFPYKNLKTLKLEELSNIYNEAAAGLVISLTNMSLLPLELLAAGTIPVVTDGPNNTKVSNNKYIHYSHSSPDALAKELVDIVDRKDLPEYAEEASASIKSLSWNKSCERFEAILRRELNV